MKRRHRNWTEVDLLKHKAFTRATSDGNQFLFAVNIKSGLFMTHLHTLFQHRTLWVALQYSLQECQRFCFAWQRFLWENKQWNHCGLISQPMLVLTWGQQSGRVRLTALLYHGDITVSKTCTLISKTLKQPLIKNKYPYSSALQCQLRSGKSPVD